MTESVKIKERHALIDCPHCGKPIRVRERTIAEKQPEADDSLFGAVFGSGGLFEKVFGKRPHA